MKPEEGFFQDLFDIGSNEPVKLTLLCNQNRKWFATIEGVRTLSVDSDECESALGAAMEALLRYKDVKRRGF